MSRPVPNLLAILNIRVWSLPVEQLVADLPLGIAAVRVGNLLIVARDLIASELNSATSLALPPFSIVLLSQIGHLAAAFGAIAASAMILDLADDGILNASLVIAFQL